MELARGQVWWVDFGNPKGSAPALRRPAAIVSANWLNRSAINTVTVVPLTSQTRRASQPGSVFVSKGAAKLRADSVVLAHQTATIDRQFLDGQVGTLPAAIVRQIDQALRLVLRL